MRMVVHMCSLPKAQGPSHAAADLVQHPAKPAAQQQAPRPSALQSEAAAPALGDQHRDALFAAFANNGPDEEFLPQRGGDGDSGWDDDFNF